jgi:hypothetical protein
MAPALQIIKSSAPRPGKRLRTRKRAANRRCHGQYQGRPQCLDEHRIAQYEAPVIEGISQDEVTDSLHEATQHQDRQWPHRQEREQ